MVTVKQGLPESVLVVNRGEIARRVIGTAKKLGIRTIALHAPADADLPYVREADESVCLEGTPPVQSYLDIPHILEVARQVGARSIHPGYGFLSENADFARAVEKEGILWIGPDAPTIEEMGDKIEARRLVAAVGIDVGGGAGTVLATIDEAVQEASSIGYPVILKASAGGGGIGMSIARDVDELRAAFDTTRDRSQKSFGSSRVFLEKYISSARHVEVQILGLADGRICALGERDCSVQRRHQKIAEESPAPRLSAQTRSELFDAAVTIGTAIGYRNAGTVEFLVDAVTGDFSFLEVNTRIQVEHPVTELVTGIDLVEQQFRIAAGMAPTFTPGAVAAQGHAIEFRIYAEDPVRFLPSPGPLSRWREPAGEGIRLDGGYVEGNEITPFFDPLIAKLCAHGPTREVALERMRAALDELEVEGLSTNVPFLCRLIVNDAFAQGRYDTSLVAALQDAVRKNKKEKVDG